MSDIYLDKYDFYPLLRCLWLRPSKIDEGVTVLKYINFTHCWYYKPIYINSAIKR